MTDDDYPDVFDALGGGKKNKQQQKPVKNAKKEEEEAAMMALPTKGKPSSFFVHQGQLSQEQMVFIITHYPQYS